MYSVRDAVTLAPTIRTQGTREGLKTLFSSKFIYTMIRIMVFYEEGPKSAHSFSLPLLWSILYCYILMFIKLKIALPDCKCHVPLAVRNFSPPTFHTNLPFHKYVTKHL